MSEYLSSNNKETRNSGNDDFFNTLGEYQSNLESLRWNGSFREYMDMVAENPGLVRSSHSTMYQAYMAQPDYFTSGKNALYGADEAFEQLEKFMRAGDQNLQLGKRILLMVGGPGSGKSTAVAGLKRLMEDYSKTDEGAMYAIKGCELNEDPMHLIPEELRPNLEEKLGIRIEGDLCEHCKLKYGQSDKLNQIADVEVERIFLSERNNVGISTFEPSDPKSQDIADLIGTVDLSKLGEFGAASDARAYKFNGAFHTANRGMLELVELLKSDEKFLYKFLSIAQERVVKTQNFPNTTVDEVLMGHSNLAEYARYMKDERNEAIRDRTYTVWWKYPLRVTDEKKVYEKLIGEGELVRSKQMHVNPEALETAATFSVMSRLKPSANLGVDKVQKMMLYDGKDVDGLSKNDLKTFATEFRDEGLTGVSPRYVIDSLSSEIVKTDKEGNSSKCLTPIGVTRALRANLDNHAHTREMSKDQKDEILKDLAMTEALYANKAVEEIKAAYLGSREDEIAAYASKYLDNVEAFCLHDKVRNEFTGEPNEPDEKFMRSIEERLNIAEGDKKEHRSTLIAQVARWRREGKEIDYTEMPKLYRAVSEKLFANIKDEIRTITSAHVPNEKQKRRIEGMKESLIEDRGYCSDCADELIRHASTLLAK